MTGENPETALTGAPENEMPVMMTQRLRLRPRSAEDAEALFAAMSDPALMTWWSRGPFTSVAELRETFASSSADWRSWAITRIGEDRAIGFVAAGKGRQAGVSEIGYFLASEAQGHGLAREALTALITKLLSEGQRRIFADCDPDNLRSIALLERLGFMREGRLRGEWQTHIGIRDSFIYGLLADEWRG